MTAGVSIESYAAIAAWSGSGFDADYPVSNLGDLYRTSQVGRVPGGACSITASFPSAPVGIVALCAANLPPSATVRVVCGAYDSGAVAAFGSWSAAYRNTRPFVFPAEVTASSATITISGAGALDIGAVEVARFWAWPGVSPDPQIGFVSPVADQPYVGGGGVGSDVRTPRTYSGQIDRHPMADAATRGLDFQGWKTQSAPFVWVEDSADADSWCRTSFLARNQSLPPLVGAVYRHDTVQVRLVEWMR